MSFDALQDPVLYAIPVFVLFMALELLALRYLDDAEDPGAGAYELRDTRTNILMGLGSVAVNSVARIVALVGYAALYVLSPLRLDTHKWWTWVLVLLAVDLLFYAEHRAAHRVRILWAAHQAHHNSQRFNLSTAVRQKWNPWWELVVWVPLPLLGVPPWMIFTAFSFNLIFQFFVHTERIDRMWAPIEFVFNTPSHHRVHHAQRPGLPRQELRGHADRLGPHVRHVRGGDAPSEVRADEEHRQLQPVPAAVPRVRRHRPRRPRRPQLAGQARLPVRAAGLDAGRHGRARRCGGAGDGRRVGPVAVSRTRGCPAGTSRASPATARTRCRR